MSQPASYLTASEQSCMCVWCKVINWMNVRFHDLLYQQPVTIRHVHHASQSVSYTLLQAFQCHAGMAGISPSPSSFLSLV